VNKDQNQGNQKKIDNYEWKLLKLREEVTRLDTENDKLRQARRVKMCPWEDLGSEGMTRTARLSVPGGFIYKNETTNFSEVVSLIFVPAPVRFGRKLNRKIRA